MNINQLPENEYSVFNSTYIKSAQNTVLLDDLEISMHDFVKFIQNIPLDKFDYRYAEGKWTIKDIIQHIIDAERIFVYRALRISRNDKTPLAGFEENSFVENTAANQRTIQDLLSEFTAVRYSNIMFYKSLTHEQLSRIGIVSDNVISVRALGFIIIGHQKHHQKVFQERYL